MNQIRDKTKEKKIWRQTVKPNCLRKKQDMCLKSSFQKEEKNTKKKVKHTVHHRNKTLINTIILLINKTTIIRGSFNTVKVP